MKKLTKVRWGIIGAGDVCEVKSGPALQQTANSELIAVMRRNGAKAKDFADRHGVPKWYDDADALINDPDINVVYIATPPHVHEYYTEKVARAGKAVYVEKPMARNHEECQRMIAVCEQYDVPLYVAYYRRSLPNFLKVKELLDEGVIGELRYVSVRLNKTLEPDIVGAAGQADNWRTDPETAGGGYFYDLACHQLDILDFLLGPIREASGYSRNQAGLYEGEDVTVGSFHFDSGVMGQGVWCFTTGASSDEEFTTIVGSRGQISFPYFGDHSVTLEVDGKEPLRFEFDITPHIQQPLIQTIVDELTGKGQCPSTGISGARTAWVMDQICRRVD
jgi:predicted dehydrogenase